MKQLLTSTALALLLAGGVAAPSLAQDAPDTMTQPNTAQDDQNVTGDTMARDQAADTDTSDDVVLIETLPANQKTISKFYRQEVYDTNKNEIGDTNDLLLDDQGRITTAIVGVGGFLGIGEKNVAVPFKDIHMTEVDGEQELMVDTTKAALEKAPGYTYDQEAEKWVPAKEDDNAS